MGYEARYQGDAGDAKADDAGAVRGNPESRLVGRMMERSYSRGGIVGS